MEWKKWVFGGLATLIGILICILIDPDSNKEKIGSVPKSTMWGIVLGGIIWTYFKNKEQSEPK